MIKRKSDKEIREDEINKSNRTQRIIIHLLLGAAAAMFIVGMIGYLWTT